MIVLKKNLQEATPYKVMTVIECLQSLDFTYDEEGTSITNIKCSCGTKAILEGLLGAERIYCPNCKKAILDITSPVPTGNATCGVLDLEDYDIDTDKHWIALDEKDGILYKE